MHLTECSWIQNLIISVFFKKQCITLRSPWTLALKALVLADLVTKTSNFTCENKPKVAYNKQICDTVAYFLWIIQLKATDLMYYIVILYFKELHNSSRIPYKLHCCCVPAQITLSVMRKRIHSDVSKDS